jgi:hypothetical protein
MDKDKRKERLARSVKARIKRKNAKVRKILKEA